MIINIIFEILKALITTIISVFPVVAKAMISIFNCFDSIKEIIIAAIFNVPVMVVSIVGIVVFVIRVSFKIYNFVTRE